MRSYIIDTHTTCNDLGTACTNFSLRVSASVIVNTPAGYLCSDRPFVEISSREPMYVTPISI